MNATEFSINDTIFIAKVEVKEVYLTCPDCCGKKFLTVILGDDSRVTIDCEMCKRGYMGPCGLITSHEFAPLVEEDIVHQIEIVDGKVRYNYIDTRFVFSNLEDATARAKELKAERDTEEAGRIKHKEHPKHSWAWHVHYHRREIREAKKKIEYNEAKLAFALTLAKEEKAKKQNGKQTDNPINEVL